MSLHQPPTIPPYFPLNTSFSLYKTLSLSIKTNNNGSFLNTMNSHSTISFFLLVPLATMLLVVTNGTSRFLSPPPEPPPPPPPPRVINSPFKPSIAVIVGILMTLFSVTFLLLLYTKHCKGSFQRTGSDGFYYPPVSDRKNSGINPVVIESLPVFRFGSVRGGPKEGLECAVCLNRFEPDEVLRLLPKCRHAFHVECVDTWLDAHSTCPLCRFRVDPEDVLLIDRSNPVGFEPLVDMQTPPVQTQRVSGRHSSAGEKGKPGLKDKTMRKSCDVSFSNGKISTVGRKDGLLITAVDKESVEKRIKISTDPVGPHQRWSDVQPCDLFYQGRRSSSAKVQDSLQRGRTQEISRGIIVINEVEGRNVINERSVSEITGLSRLADESTSNYNSVVATWMSWISQSGTRIRS